MNPIFTVGQDYATGLLAYAGQITTDVKLLIILAIGLPLGFWAAKRIIGLIRAH